MKYTIAVILIAVALLTGCKKDSESSSYLNPEYFEFGYYGGFGSTDFFVIRNNQLFPIDSTKPALDNSKYLKAKVLLDQFPSYLITHPNQNFGCLGCLDEPVIGIHYKKDGVVYNWNMDTDSQQLPVELRAYVAEVYKITTEL